MGRPSNNDLDRELESPIDDAWSTDADEPVAAADADRTTIRTGEEAIAPVGDDGRVVDHQATGIGADRIGALDHDRAIGTGEDRIEPGVEVSVRAASEHDRTTIADDSPATATDHERTTVAVGAERAARKIVDDLFAEVTDHDRTTVAAGADRVACEMADGSPAKATDDDRTKVAAGAREMVDDSPTQAADHDRTTFGMGVVTSTRPIASSAAKPKLPDQKHGLVQPERSPLALVMGDMAASTGAPQAHASGDSSRLVAALMGDELPAPERVAEAESPITAIPPKLMARRRRRWVAAGALATTVVVGTLFGMRFRAAAANRGDRQAVGVIPTPAGSNAITGARDPAPATPAPATPAPATPAATPAPATPPATPAPAIAQPAPPASSQESETPPAAPVVDVAMAAPSRTVTKPSTRPAIAKKTVATSNVPAKRPSTRKAAKPKASAAKPSTTTSTATVKKKKRSFF